MAWSGGSKRPDFIKTLDELDLGLPVQYLTKGKTCYLRWYFLGWFRFLKNWSCKLPFSQSFPKETLRFAQVAADSDLVVPGFEMIDLAALVWDSLGEQGDL